MSTQPPAFVPTALRSAFSRDAVLPLALAVALGMAIATLVGCPASDRPGDAPAADPSETRPNLLVISLDTVRADRLGLYGWHRPTSPTLDALAERSVVFERALAPASITAPSHATLLTGRSPWRHGTVRNGQPLGGGVPLLGEVLAARGWRTGAFVSGFPLTGELSGLSRGFDHYDDAVKDLRRPGVETVDAALAWLDRSSTEAKSPPVENPFFAFVHLYDAHGPYEPPAELERLFVSEERGPFAPRFTLIPFYQRQVDPETGKVRRDLRHYTDRYEAAIRQVDDQVGRLLAAVDLQSTVVLVVSDHGETLLERHVPIDHGSRLFEEQLRIVAILSAPNLPAQRVEAQVGMADFAPTLLDLLGVDPPENPEIGAELLVDPDDSLDGRSLRPLLDGRRTAWRDRHLATTAANGRVLRYRGYRVVDDALVSSVEDAGWKLILYPGAEGDFVELYDLRADPDELVDLSEEHPEQVERLRALVDPAQRDAARGAVIDPEAAARLRALGYVAGS